MDSQLRSEIKRIKKRDIDQGKTREWRQHKTAAIEAKLPGLWTAIVKAIGVDVDKLNTEFSADPSRHVEFRKAERNFTLHKSHYPAVKLEISIDLQVPIIKCCIVETLSPHATPSETDLDFDIDLDDAGYVYVKDINQDWLKPQDFSTRLLTQITRNM